MDVIQYARPRAPYVYSGFSGPPVNAREIAPTMDSRKIFAGVRNLGQSTAAYRGPISRPNHGLGVPIFVTILARGPLACFGPTLWPILTRD